MKTSEFKKIIQEAVKDEIKHELREIKQLLILALGDKNQISLDEGIVEQKPFKIKPKEISSNVKNLVTPIQKETLNPELVNNSNNPFLSLLVETAQNMTPGDKIALTNLGNSD